MILAAVYNLSHTTFYRFPLEKSFTSSQCYIPLFWMIASFLRSSRYAPSAEDRALRAREKVMDGGATTNHHHRGACDCFPGVSQNPEQNVHLPEAGVLTDKSSIETSASVGVLHSHTTLTSTVAKHLCCSLTTCHGVLSCCRRGRRLAEYHQTCSGPH